MNTAHTCSARAPSEWHGRVPFLYKEYLQTGMPSGDFGRWISLFRGNSRPEDDISQFLSTAFRIEVQNLQAFVDSEDISNELRWAGKRLWEEAHTERRQGSFSVDDSITQHLIENDIEVYLGVVALRKKERVSELGYQHWLLTFDKMAWDIRDKLKAEFGRSDAPPSPLMSHAFLVNNLMFGPCRRQASNFNEMSLPIFLDVELSESSPFNILSIANNVRKDNENLPEYVIQRKVRDAIDTARHRSIICNTTESDAEE